MNALFRRALTIPSVLLVFTVALVTFPLTFPLAYLVDLLTARSTRPTTRLITFLTAALATEVFGLAMLLVVFLRSPFNRAKRQRLTWPAQRRYIRTHLFFVSALYRLKFTIDAGQLAFPGPVLVFINHASIIDTLIPAAFLAPLELRYVLKKELLVGPCLDLAGHWLPNHFVSRDGNDSEKEVAAVRALKAGIDDESGVLLYPEGTRFTAAKRERLLSTPVRARAERLTHLLPVRPGGALALLDAAPACDVLFVAHQGLEGFSTIRAIWSGELVDRTISIRLWRASAATIPTNPDARLAWLDAHWERLDHWLANSK